MDLGNNNLATNGAGFTKLGIGTGGYAYKNGSFYLWTNVANSGLSLTMTNVAAFGGNGALDADGLYNISGNGPAYFTISNLPPGMSVTLYACWAWNAAAHAPIILIGGTQITVTNNGEMSNPSLQTLQPVGTATAAADGTVSGSWYGVGGGTNKEGQIGALIINVGPCRPVLILNGANPIGVQINTPFVDPGATAFETCGGPVSLSTNGTVDITQVGTYTLTYTAISTADNATNSVTRTVNVWNNDILNLDLAKSGDGISTPAGFNRLNWANANPLSFSVVSANGSTYTVGYTNVSGTYNTTKYNTIDQDGFYVNSGVTAGFYLSGMIPGDVVTLYACWAWDGAGNPGVVTFGGSTQTLNVGTDITSPSAAAFMQIGSAVVDDTGTVRGTWTGLAGKQGQMGGMIFTVSPPGSFSVSPAGITNNCGGSATFTATLALGATNYQWYNPSLQPLPGATNTTLVLNDTHPSDSGTYLIVATGPTWASTNSVVLLTTDISPPLITLNGTSTNVVLLGGTYTEPGATAYDTCAGNSLTVTIGGAVNTGVVGEYDITYSATTGAGTPGSLQRIVMVVDPTLKNLVIAPSS
ncbi:MAG: immunoglobulin-like domain-containing protein, partial [Limisphaerales bacterium]